MKLGLLLTRSVLYPSMSFDMLDGVKSALQTEGFSDVQVMTANIGLAAQKEEIYIACEKLILEGAQVIMAYINPASAEFIHPLFENSGTLLLVLDSGYHFPSSLKKLSHAFYISLQGTLCCRITSRLAVDAGGKDFVYATSFYDAGYLGGYTFANSLDDQGGRIVFNHVTPLRRADLNLEPLSAFVKEHTPDGVLAAFCGDMAEDFLTEAGKHDLFSNGKLFGSPFMAEEIWLEKISYPGNDWQCATTWVSTLNNEENKKFVQKLTGIRAGKANIFSLLTWEAGLFAAEILRTKASPEMAIKQLEGKTLKGPRGNLYISADTHWVESPVYQVSITQNTVSGTCRVDTVSEVPYTEEERKRFYNDIQSLPSTTNMWLNAYACLDS